GARRVGRERHARPGGRRAGVRRSDRRQRPPGGLRRHRPPVDDRAADAVQRAGAALPGGRAGAREGRGGRQRVTAPSAALETSFAYLASTPTVSVGGGGS